MCVLVLREVRGGVNKMVGGEERTGGGITFPALYCGWWKQPVAESVFEASKNAYILQ